MAKDKTLVAYFSCGGTTETIAKNIAKNLACDLVEIQPSLPYTMEDLNWKNKSSRSSLEMQDETSRPDIVDIGMDLSHYSTVLIGFPIWWGICPRVILSFLEKYDLKGKTLATFATSGGSKIDYVEKYLKNLLKEDYNLRPGKMFGQEFNLEDFQNWYNIVKK